MLSDMQCDVRGVSEIEGFCEEVSGHSVNKIDRRALKKSITDKLIKSGMLSFSGGDSSKKKYHIYGEEITSLAIKFQEEESPEIHGIIESYYMEYVYYNWLKCAHLYSDRQLFLDLYRERIFFALRNFDKNKKKKVRKNIYCASTKKWKSVPMDEVRLDEDGNPMLADFNDYFFSVIRYMIISEWNRQKNPKYSPFVICMECEKKVSRITNEHLSKHGLNIYEYKEMYPQAKLYNTPMSLDQEVQDGCSVKDIYTVNDKDAFVVDNNIVNEELEFIVSIMDNELDAKIAVLRYLRFTDHQIVSHLNTTLKEVRKRKVKLNLNSELKEFIISFSSHGSKRQYYKKENKIKLSSQFWRSVACLRPF